MLGRLRRGRDGAQRRVLVWVQAPVRKAARRGAGLAARGRRARRGPGGACARRSGGRRQSPQWKALCFARHPTCSEQRRPGSVQEPEAQARALSAPARASPGVQQRAPQPAHRRRGPPSAWTRLAAPCSSRRPWQAAPAACWGRSRSAPAAGGRGGGVARQRRVASAALTLTLCAFVCGRAFLIDGRFTGFGTDSLPPSVVVRVRPCPGVAARGASAKRFAGRH